MKAGGFTFIRNVVKKCCPVAEWIMNHFPEVFEFDYKNAERRITFAGTHPQ